jgi:integrase
MLMDAVRRYVRARRDGGFDVLDAERVLSAYARFAHAKGERHVDAKMAIDWAARSASAFERERRLRHIARFARHARAEDRRHQVPPTGVFGRRLWRRPTPFIFSPEETLRLVEAAGELPPRGSLRPHTYKTLFALLASTGLRISEALALRFDDFGPDGLIIRRTKFRKSRLVPIHETVRLGISRYLDRRRGVETDHDYIFISLRSDRLTHQAAHHAFREIVDSLGLDPGRATRAPRLHDLRHTFAVRALEACSANRGHVGKHMLALSTYLGHATVNATYWYLEATPHLMMDIAEATARFVKGQR